MQEKKNYLNIEVCKRCGGKCCKRMPGGCMPEDFGESLFENLTKAFQTGNYAIDWWIGDPTEQNEIERGYFVRPKIKGVNKIYHPSWGGECIFFTDGKGCKLQPNERPANCRLLEPKENERCKLHGVSKREIAIAWIPFHKIIHKAAKE